MSLSTPPPAMFRTALCALVLAATTSLAHAADRRVPSQYPTIQAAVNAAASSGDRVLVANGTYTGVGNRDIDPGTKNIVIQSETDNPANCTIDCQYLGRAFYIHGGQTSATVIRGFTIYRGSASFGGGIANNASASLINCRFISNRADGGGGVFNTGGMITNCTFTENSANLFGGGIDDIGGVVTGCTFQQNRSNDAAGMSAERGTRVTNCTFIANTATINANGWVGTGAITALDGNHTEINCTFVRNTGGIGAIFNTAGGTQINCSFYGNKANAYPNATNNKGGAIYNQGGGKQINCIIYGNTATGGGNEIYNQGPGSVQNSCIIGGLPATRDVNGNFGANPQFYYAEGDDLHIGPSSPAVNSGANVTSPDISTDIEGFPRITNSFRDIGAYELHSSIVAYSLNGGSVNRYQVGIGLVNPGRFTETNIKITSATLGGYAATTPMPLTIGQALPGETKATTLSFGNGYFPYGSYQLLIVSGTSSLGPFSYYIPVYVY